jgi:hypothetical protein
MIIFHRFLIGTAILFCAGFTVWALRAFRVTGDSLQLLLGVAFGLATVALVYYLKNLRRFLRR